MTTSINPELTFTLDEAVEEVLLELTGLGLAYDPSHDRYRAIAKMLNRALRANALEHEWSYYNSVLSLGTSTEGQVGATVPNTARPRMTGDDAVRLVNDDNAIVRWAYFLPRDALHKYAYREGLWVAIRRTDLVFSRALFAGEADLDIQLPVQREPAMFVIPPTPDDPEAELDELDEEIRTQPIDFSYPDVICARAAYMYSLTDPVMQPRAQTLEAGYKDLMYQVIERDDRFTDAPIQNDFVVPVSGGLTEPVGGYLHPPYADERGR